MAERQLFDVGVHFLTDLQKSSVTLGGRLRRRNSVIPPKSDRQGHQTRFDVFFRGDAFYVAQA